VKPETRVSLAVSIAWGLLVSVAGYAILRGLQAVLSPAADPARLVWSAHAGFFWRAWTVSYAGGIAAFVTLALARGRSERAARALAPGVVVAASLLVLQSVIFP
jgi:hypothetical protein